MNTGTVYDEMTAFTEKDYNHAKEVFSYDEAFDVMTREPEKRKRGYKARTVGVISGFDYLTEDQLNKKSKYGKGHRKQKPMSDTAKRKRDQRIKETTKAAKAAKAYKSTSKV